MQHRSALALLVVLGLTGSAFAAEAPADQLYKQLREAPLTSTLQVNQLAVKLDRLEMKLTGRLYLGKAVAGAPREAVFQGSGQVRIAPPPAVFERDTLRRLIKADTIDTAFENAVFRFSAAPWSNQLSVGAAEDQTPPTAARELAAGLRERLPRETGLNLDARLLQALTGDLPGSFFFAQFDGGPLKRFSFLFDASGRLPTFGFGINAGEKGLVFSHVEPDLGNDIWLAFRAEQEYRQGIQPNEPDDFLTRAYAIQIDGRQVNRRKLAVRSELTIEPRRPLRSLTFDLNDGLQERRKLRSQRALAVRSATVNGQPATVIQEPWQIGFAVLPPEPLPPGNPAAVVVQTEGDFILNIESDQDLYGNAGGGEFTVEAYYRDDLFYPSVTNSWYPRHGFLQTSTYTIEILHANKYRAISVGKKIKEERHGDHTVTVWQTPQPVWMATFAIGLFESASAALPGSDNKGTATYHFKGGNLGNDKQTYMLTELSNGVNFFSQTFGAYPFGDIHAVMHPRRFGQSFPGLLLLPPTGQRTNMFEFQFLAHEAAHQWWGHMVSWRSYRDQWLSEGFADYSGIIYTGVRMDKDASLRIIRGIRRALSGPPATFTGVGSGRVAELGPIVLGFRSSTTATADAYQRLIYGKGALVLRMVHFLLSDPATGKDDAFYEMLKDFVRRYPNLASTEDFATVASEHFVRSPLGRKHNFRDLGWFLRQWVFESNLPSYSLKYAVEPQGNQFVLKGTLRQLNAAPGWVMPLPLVIRFGKDRTARGTVLANGPESPVSIPLPEKPSEVLLDPDLWVLSAATEIEK